MSNRRIEHQKAIHARLMGRDDEGNDSPDPIAEPEDPDPGKKDETLEDPGYGHGV